MSRYFGLRFAVLVLLSSHCPNSAPGGEDEHDAESVVGQLQVHPELQLELFAAEPMLVNPANIDIDHRGRVWVCEIMNYRKPRRAAGDRILILEDTDGDGRADESHVFYQGSDIDSPHGICVLSTPAGKGTRAIVSAGSRVVSLIDTDGDDRADQQEDLFTGISGVQHDHGIHAFVFGPDSRLYFNFGNMGGQLRDKTGQSVFDSSGREVASHGKPYRQGMLFRCLPDGSHVETLGWNFRNNWEVTVDSFGNVWQSDNDDDGNRGVRMNFVLEYGNYGFRDERTGADWKVQRTGWHDQIAYRHWHQNDPGVVPNLLHTGAGSPTGITVYEGDLLGETFQGQVIHCDAGAGPAVCRAYPVKRHGAGFEANIVDLASASQGSLWFRPSDVSVAPDGSLIVSDWYDPGVGGHQIGDTERGRLYRLTPQGHSGYQVPSYDFETAQGAVEALKSPNYAARAVACRVLVDMAENASDALESLAQHENPRWRARALWILGMRPGYARKSVRMAGADEAAELRAMSVRMARRLAIPQFAAQLVDDPSPAVRRECAIALKQIPADQVPALWSRLAAQHIAGDRWYLEALGIGASDHADACMEAWLAETGDHRWKEPAGREIVWRIRAKQCTSLLAELITDPGTDRMERNKYFRAFDFHDGEGKEAALRGIVAELAFPKDGAANPLTEAARDEGVVEALTRLSLVSLDDAPRVKAAVVRQLRREPGSPRFWGLIERFELHDFNDTLLQLSLSEPDGTNGVRAAEFLKRCGELPRVWECVDSNDPQASLAALTVLGHVQDAEIAERLEKIALQPQRSLALRKAACVAIGRQIQGQRKLLAQVQAKQLADDLKFTVANILLVSSETQIRADAAQHLSLPQTADRESLPPLADLVKLSGDAQQGQEIFRTTGACAKCHQVGDVGKSVGPQLAEIGSKLSREALYVSILDPNAGISHGYENYNVLLEDGRTVVGLLANETDEAVTIKTAEAIDVKISRNEIDEMAKLPISLMPAGIERVLTQQQLVDIVEYMTTLTKK